MNGHIPTCSPCMIQPRQRRRKLRKSHQKRTATSPGSTATAMDTEMCTAKAAPQVPRAAGRVRPLRSFLDPRRSFAAPAPPRPGGAVIPRAAIRPASSPRRRTSTRRSMSPWREAEEPSAEPKTPPQGKGPAPKGKAPEPKRHPLPPPDAAPVREDRGRAQKRPASPRRRSRGKSRHQVSRRYASEPPRRGARASLADRRHRSDPPRGPRRPKGQKGRGKSGRGSPRPKASKPAATPPKPAAPKPAPAVPPQPEPPVPALKIARGYVLYETYMYLIKSCICLARRYILLLSICK